MRGGTRSPDGLRLQDEALDGAEEPLSVEVVAPAALAHEESIRLRGDEVGEDVGALVDVDVPLQHPPVDTPEDPRADVMVTAFVEVGDESGDRLIRLGGDVQGSTDARRTFFCNDSTF